MTSFLQKLPECCDAWQYLELGQQCATTGVCHGPLRPGGAYYWFSLPYRLGVSADILILLSIVLLSVSVVLAYRVLLQLIRVDRVVSPPQRRLIKAFSAIVVLAIHAVFFVPTLFNALSDPPAAALFLTGALLLIKLALAKEERREVGILLIAGICWGLSAWLRAFFLYPVLVGVAFYVGIRLWSRVHRRGAMMFCVALIPIAAQYATIYKTYGSFSYLNKGLSDQVGQMHLVQPYAGYDTLLPHGSHFWYPQTCEAQYGVWLGLKEKRWEDVWCVISNRLYFYLGTYRPITYIYPGRERLLVPGSSESIGENDSNWYTNMHYIRDVGVAPSGEQSADKLEIAVAGQLNEIKQWISLEAGESYTFSLWLWSPLPRTLLIGYTPSTDGNRVVAYQTVKLTPEPVRYSVTGTMPETTEYNVVIGDIPPSGETITFGQQAGDHLFAWGAQLEEGNEMTEYVSNLPVDPDRIRIWSPTRLVINGLALVLALAFMLMHYRVFWVNVAGFAVTASILVSGAEALAIIPEQRFFITLIVFAWLMTFALAGKLFVKVFTEHFQGK